MPAPGDPSTGVLPGVIPTADMLSGFNAWMRADGHVEWTEETFHGRFLAHERTTAAGVEKRRVRRVTEKHTVSRFPGGALDIGGQPQVYVGVCRRADDDEPDTEVFTTLTNGTVHSVPAQWTLSENRPYREVPEGSARSAQPPSSDADAPDLWAAIRSLDTPPATPPRREPGPGEAWASEPCRTCGGALHPPQEQGPAAGGLRSLQGQDQLRRPRGTASVTVPLLSRNLTDESEAMSDDEDHSLHAEINRMIRAAAAAPR